MLRLIYINSFFAAVLLLTGCAKFGQLSHERPVVFSEAENTSVGSGSSDVSQSAESSHPESASNSDSPNNQDIYQRLINGFAFDELESNTEVDDYIRWSIEHPTYLNNLFERAQYFLHYFVEEIEKRGLPSELALLPAIESAYKPYAISRSRAAGLWQFIPSTGKHFGLEQNWWYDGRQDLVKSTNAALDYLTSLNQKFDGDWFLTLAAYNGGQGTLRKAIKKNLAAGKSINYESLDLRSETKRYVPKLIGLKKVIQYAEQFDINLPTIEDETKLSTIAISRQINLDDFAKRTGINDKEFRFLNSAFKRWATPPIIAGSSYHLVVPKDKIAQAQSVISEIAKEPQVQYTNYVVRSGDTLSQIGARYGVSVGALKSTNNLRNNRIRIGKQLLIPSEPKLVFEPQGQGASLASRQNGKTDLTHQVSRGDTLWSIANQYQVQIEQLLTWNNLASNETLYPNQLLKIHR